MHHSLPGAATHDALLPQTAALDMEGLTVREHRVQPVRTGALCQDREPWAKMATVKNDECGEDDFASVTFGLSGRTTCNP